ncbi:hypothetical protein M9Y10_031793 [Tritrichomonas musculus]|uniref:Surface antigen BspA-like n=1 Tax=Tritrichomonas musculus TaxID=1915356 RepID=A0ABR2GZV8_9EUKA
MEIEVYIKQKQEIYSSLLEYIQSTDDSGGELNEIYNSFQKAGVFSKKEQLLETLQLISKIEDNRHRASDSYEKLEKIFDTIFSNQKTNISSSEIIQIFKKDKRILLLLLEKEFIKPDKDAIFRFIHSPNRQFLFGGLKNFIDEKTRKQIEEEITKKYEESIESFEKKCRIGENDSYICTLIQQDLVEDFISHVTRSNYSLTSNIEPTIYETNSFLMRKTPTLIEYATFYGSIQIIQYLKYNNVPLTESLWLYAVHSNNADMIHFLEGTEIIKDNSDKKIYDEVIRESIKCHHNDITDYIKDNLSNRSDMAEVLSSDFTQCIINSDNYYYFPTDIEHIITHNTNKNDFSISMLCFSITTITIPSSVTTIGDNAFANCLLLTQITIPPTVASIGSRAFFNCKSMKNIIIPSCLTIINDETFRNCLSLTEISVPSSVKEIGEGAFCGCQSLKQISFPPVSTIKNNTFKDCISLAEIEIPDTVTSIGDFAFNRCSSLTKITVPSLVKSIGFYAFRACTSLNEINLPNSLEIIRENAFERCSSLKQILIPKFVTFIRYESIPSHVKLIRQ